MDINKIKKTGKRKGLWLGSITGDLFSLGGHWIYDLDILNAQFPHYDKPQEPLEDTFHKTKMLGDLTHYGDQALHLWQHLADHAGHYDPAAYRKAWFKYMKQYSGYLDKASRDSLVALEKKHPFGSSSRELGATARIAAIYYWIEEPAAALAAALDQSKMTHNSEVATAVSYLTARTLQNLLDVPDGTEPSVFAELEKIKDLMIAEKTLDMALLVDSFAVVKELEELSAPSIAKTLGQTCDVSHGLPTLLAVLKATEDYRQAMELNVMIGGDSAARAMVLGALIGAKSGAEAVPTDWYLL